MSESNRPNPDSLLAAVASKEPSLTRGKLKIFFGACAGVGKTFTMLEAAQSKKRQGVDVVVGIVETHKRSETEVLLQGLEVLPQKKIPYKGVVLHEFDIDQALRRKPSLILVDELAHTNTSGSRNLKRWQDVEELLKAGINVYTALNTQHLESLNDVVAKITGILVRETVPDSFFDLADDVELVDLPVGELLQRLKEGKVYTQEQAAGRASENFFQEGNLFALRELALRKTAQRVDIQMRQYRTLHAIQKIWQAGERFLVGVSSSPLSTRLIRRTKQLADDLKVPWIAVYVETPQRNILEAERKRIEEQLHFAESLGAETIIVQGLKIDEEILKLAREKNVTKIVLGKPTHPRWKDMIGGSFLDSLIRKSGDIDVYVVSGEKEEKSFASFKSRFSEKEISWLDYLIPSLAITAWSLFSKWILPPLETTNIAMMYLLINVLITLRYGQGPSLLSAFLSVAFLDFFFVPPFFTFFINEGKYVATFFTLFAVTFLTSRLMIRLRRSAEGASKRERYTSNLYLLSREMLKNRNTTGIARNTAQCLSQIIHGDVVILLGSEPDIMFLEASSNPDWHFTPTDWAVAQWVCKNSKIAGMGTQTLPAAKAIFFPLTASRGLVGVLGLRPREDHFILETSSEHFIENVASQTALTIERAMLMEETREAEKEAEREGLVSSLLSSVSHDLRTPLTSIAGAASTLLTSESRISLIEQRKLLEMINSEAYRLNRLVTNLLQMTKIESGSIHLHKEVHSLEEIIGSTLNRLNNLIQDRPIHLDIPSDLPMVSLDDLLMEQVMINLIENVLRYTPENSGIDIQVIILSGENIEVRVMDRGPGINPEEEGRVFEKFYRSPSQNDVYGSGLGLAICQGILKAHGGKIGVRKRDGGGSIFYFQLPLEKT